MRIGSLPLFLTAALLLARIGAGQDRPVRLSPPVSHTGGTLRPVSNIQPVEASPRAHLPPSSPAPEALPQVRPQPANDSALTLADLENMALSGNPSIARAAALVQAARGNWVQVGLRPNPTVGYEGQQLGSGGRAEQHGIYAEQEIVRGGKLELNRQVAAQEWAQAERDLAAQQQRVLTDVRIAFFSVLVAQEQQQVATELVRIATGSLNAAKALLQAQEVGEADVLQAEIEIENAHIAATNARNRHLAAWQNLSAVIGQPKLPLQRLAGDPTEALPQFRFDDVLQRLLTSSPEVASAIANVERARWAVQRAQVEAVPNVTLTGMVNVIDNGIDGRTDGNVVLGVPLPLWNKNQGGIIQAQGEVAAAERAVDQLELDLQNRLAPVFERYANASNQVARYQRIILPAAQKSFTLVRQSYEAGEQGYTSLLTAQRTYSQTRLAYLEALRELRVSGAQLEGYLLDDSLQSR